MGGWQEATRRALIGGKVELKTVPGLWIAPRKLSTAVSDQIGEMQRASLTSGDNRQKSKELRALEERLIAEGKKLDDADPLELMAVQPVIDPAVRASIYRLALSDGVGEHNFTDDAGAAIGDGKAFDKDTIEAILEWDDLARELFDIIREWSRPLASRSEGKSSS